MSFKEFLNEASTNPFPGSEERLGSLKVMTDIWLQVNKNSKPLKWTDKKPSNDNGFIKKGTVLNFESEKKGIATYRLGNSDETSEWTHKNIDSLEDQEVLKLI